MGVYRNAATTIAVTTLLVVSLIVLFPAGAQAATISHVAPGASSIPAGTAADLQDDTIRATATITIPTGEHIPIDVAEIYGVLATTNHGGNIATGAVDTLDCSGTTTIQSISSSLARVDSSFTGYGYTAASVADNGYGYGYQYGYSYQYGAKDFDFTGSGYGYGYGSTAGGTVTITVVATGCDVAQAAPGIPTVPYDIQVLVGSASEKLASLPAYVEFTNAACGGGASCNVATADGGGVTLHGSSTTDTGEIAITQIPNVSSVRLTSTTAVPAGSKIEMVPSDSASFGVPTTSISGVLALHIQLKVVDANGNDISNTLGIQVTLKFNIPKLYFDSNPTLSTSQVTLQGFRAGATTSYQSFGATLLGFDTPNNRYNYQAVISSFSSFAAGATAASGGGGGSTTTTPVVVTDADNDGLDDAWETRYFGDISATPGADDDGDGLTNLEEFLKSTNPTSRDSDGDGISDGDEVSQGTNPLDASDPAAVTPGTPPATPPTTPGDPVDEPKKTGSKTPGFEMVALVAALGAALLVARRR
jgi:hypothetical protein